MSRNSEDREIAETLIDQHGSEILTAASKEPVAVRNIVEETEMSRATAYRRVEALNDSGLLEKVGQVDETGTQYHVYQAAFESIKLEIVNGITYVHVIRDDGHDLTQISDYR
ncbi:hypothetical protein EA462_02050 [Natrarchaeobius halalkaliphilus]|uniref:HTH iclR-type domain-containing protein n=1 Tax=Natrarchaeobius halalkaliphilus TaxID=1679091 RepID=A0A3N6LW30_9EURY|nr:helix-turn-helix domain-containing protein [Natrarchaeobius halalkaliphilus]RQG93017.1 hypothetical protein EA462_02050 [Natrarchaeobius halalkaliphilus]